MANNDIRLLAKSNNVPLWKVAKKLNISDPTMTRLMREELPEAEKQKIISIIKEIAKENEV